MTEARDAAAPEPSLEPASECAPPCAPPCVFCRRIAAGKVFAANELAAATFDKFPVAPGHALVLSRRHEADWFALSGEEQAAILALARVVRDRVAGEQHPDGWNVGVNVGAAAGQSVMHVHLHVIPRRFGDRAEPRRAFGR